MIRKSLLAALVICMVGVLAIAQQQPDPVGAAAKLRSLGQAMQMYAAENKGFVPADLESLQKYLGKDSRTGEFVYLLRPGTKIYRLRQPATQPAAISAVKGDSDPLLVLFVDGHVRGYVPAKLDEMMPTTQPAKTSPAMMDSGNPAAPLPTSVMENPAKGIIGAWKVSVAEFDAVYTFTGDGSFTLTFSPTPRSQWNGPGSGRASGTWTLQDNKLVMTNAASDTPFTVVGEKEEAQVVGLDAEALVLKTTDRKGKDENCVLRRTVRFEKGKRDNDKIVGTWTAGNGGVTLVLGESGLAVMSPFKGEWSQHGQKLVVILDPRAPAERAAVEYQRPMRPRPVEQPARREFTIDLVNDTTLVLTGNLTQDSRATDTITFMRAK